jgi:uncharacterized protein YukE
MGDQVVAELPALETAEDAFRRAHQQLMDELESLDVRLKASLRDWSDEARDAYDQRHREWMKSAHDMAGQTYDLHRFIARARKNYHVSLQVNHTMWRPV